MTPRPGQRPTQPVQLDVLPDLTNGLTVEFDQPLAPESRRLMEVLGVTAIEPELEVRYHVPASQVWPNSRGMIGTAHLYLKDEPLCGRSARYVRELHEGEPHRCCSRCGAKARKMGLGWPA